MILTTVLNHGPKYYFKVHKKKLENICEDAKLKEFLYETLKNCPDKYFLKGPRSSVLKVNLDADIQNQDHEIKLLARLGLESNYYNDAHLNVQTFLLAYDEKTIAMEVPIWMHVDEHEKYEELLKTNKTLSGHIDLIRIENGKIWVWDFKPNAHREKFAHTQTYFYAYMLSQRTGIALENFMCGYFDDKNVYVFSPSKVQL